MTDGDTIRELLQRKSYKLTEEEIILLYKIARKLESL